MRHDTSKIRSRYNCRAFTLVEFLVVLVMLTIISVGLGKAISMLLTIQQNYQQETDAIEQLATEAARIENSLSLAKDVTGTLNNAIFPLEAGGVSFETNRIAGVSEYCVAVLESNVFETTTAIDPQHSGTRSRSRTIFFDHKIGTNTLISIIVEGTQAVKRLKLVANVQEQLLDGSHAVTNKLLVLERPIRLWNHK
jgi:prepilin-type N-terminal cleavage/methylation domain-containing protein